MTGSRRVGPAAPDPGEVQVAAAAAGAPDLAAVHALATGCTACADLVASRTTVVPGAFPTGAELLIVGEAPGAQEDQAGVPFIGKAGLLLDRLLAEVGLDRDRIAVTNVVKCRPARNRTPTRAEVSRCRSWLERQVGLLDPRLVCTLGGTATGWALGPGVRIGAVRGVAQPWRDRLLLPTYHPSAAIRFGPAGAPMAALRADLALAAGMLRDGSPQLRVQPG